MFFVGETITFLCMLTEVFLELIEKEHIQKGITEYLKSHKVKKFRIDIIGITLKPELKIEHFRNYGLQ